ncbi:MAG: LysM peptidoglycan-binding domain-containing protein [Gloeocapsa sp. DLM2.Bin57]|nr:MAG: LysM peptidoglycan-binding domain-containing protein [Gloeocapsa sp. DLM2.Bin57]
MRDNRRIEPQSQKQVSENQTGSRNSKAMVCLALSMGATTALLPEQVVANSLANPVQAQGFNLDKQLKSSPVNPRHTSNQALNLIKKDKQTTTSLTTVKVNKPPKTIDLNSNLPEETVHIVKFGDTINEIAASYRVSPQELASINQISNPELIEVNQRLVIPKAPKPTAEVATPPTQDPHLTRLRAEVIRLRQEHQRPENTPVQLVSVTKTETKTAEPISPILAKFREDVVRLRKQYESEQPEQPSIIASVQPSDVGTTETEIVARQPNIPELPPLLAPEEYLPETPPNLEVFDGYIWPAKGVFTSGFGWRWGRMHQGIDIAGPIGTPIHAAASGEVIYAGWHAYGYGNLVKIRHYNGSVTLYAHNNRLLVRRGQTVEQGQQIAEMGSTGYSTGPHLHFEIHPYQQGPVNPLAHLPSR